MTFAKPRPSSFRSPDLICNPLCMSLSIFFTIFMVTISTSGCQMTDRAATPTSLSESQNSLAIAPPPSSASSTAPSPNPNAATHNVMSVTVNGSLCSPDTSAHYINKPCVSVTLCEPGTTQCQTISDILVDTGSYGLRIFPSASPQKNEDGTTSYRFASALSPPGFLKLPPVQQAGLPIADCAEFMSGDALWGPVVSADVILTPGGEIAASLPIQVIDASYGGIHGASHCDSGNVASVPTDAGFHGILGLGLWPQDCGTLCDPLTYTGYSVKTIATITSYSPYFTCNGTTCSPILVSVANQVTNPISAFPVNNNGLIFALPNISPSGATAVNGTIILGIGTGGNTNNPRPNASQTYYADQYARFATLYNDVTYADSDSPDSGNTGSFIDSGSNSLLFPPAPSLASTCCTDTTSVNLVNGQLETTTRFYNTPTLCNTPLGTPDSPTQCAASCASPPCTCSYSSGWLCPSTVVTGSVTNKSVDYETGAPLVSGMAPGNSHSDSFSVGNFFTLYTGNNMVFSQIAAASDSCTSNSLCLFDFGLPFFFGKNIYVGLQKKSTPTLRQPISTLLQQPYWAY